MIDYLSVPLRSYPTSKQVRDVLGQIRIGLFLVDRNPNDQQQDLGELWRLKGPPDADGVREIVEQFDTYREAIRAGRKLAAVYARDAEVVESFLLWLRTNHFVIRAPINLDSVELNQVTDYEIEYGPLAKIRMVKPFLAKRIANKEPCRD